jgi:Ala-tRNA(Pro) deacylase
MTPLKENGRSRPFRFIPAESARNLMTHANGPTVFERLRAVLQAQEIPHDVLHHEPVFTSEQAAQVRGVPLASGAKALICKVDERFVLFVLPADRKLDSKRARSATGAKGLRFATREEVLERTALAPGSIPPFGSLFSLETICDEALAEQERINFNAGDHAISVSMRYEDYLRAERPKLAVLSA